MTVKIILTDIEGTTSAISFVHDVLFPYAARHMASFVQSHAEDDAVSEQLDAVAQESGRDRDDVKALIIQLLEWIEEDRKITPLKALQGMIWKQGFEEGAFTGHVYQDAEENLRRWHEKGFTLYIYSSGSVEAQKLMFGHSDFGNLTPLFSGYFDTQVGGKKEVQSYQNIVTALGVDAGSILFLSDVLAELDAAQAAGLQTAHLVRGEQSSETSAAHPVARDFNEVSSQAGL